MELIPAEALRNQACNVLTGERKRLQRLGIDGQLLLVGGCSVAAALTYGDVDLHLRVAPEAFVATVETLEGVYEVVRPEIWAPTLATFAVAAALPAGLAVTPAGSSHDLRFTRTWQLLAQDPALLAEYNGLKAADADGGYESRKSDFFDRVVDAWPTHPAGGLTSHPGRGG